MEPEEVRRRAANLPREPGVYQFLGVDGTTRLYVGKAVDLRDRVRSYSDPRSERVRRMVQRATDLDYAVTDTETQALLLEANLIKRHQPRFNVRLKDDKSYPLVQLTDHPIPRIEITRDPDPGATVFGPYTDKGRLETVVKALRETHGLRGCSDHKYANRDRPCLDYEMGLCSAPCVEYINEEEYTRDVGSVIRFFEGESGVLTDPLERAMEEAADTREFERAANIRDRLAAVRSFHTGGEEAVNDPDDDERVVDVIAAAIKGKDATVARLHSEHGKLVDRSQHTLNGAGESSAESAGEVIGAFLVQYYAERELPDAVLLSEWPADGEVHRWLDREGVAVRVPGAGREARLVELAIKNARRRPAEVDETAALGNALGIDHPDRIEGFDVSHVGGESVVGSNVMFVNGTAEKSGYRRKKLTERNDDFRNMYELVRWRAERAVEDRDARPDPDLLVIDGGKGQLDAAESALAETGWEIPVVALAKDEERVTTDGEVHDWDDDTPQLHLLQRVRDEAHRFAVQYHRGIRDEVETVLEEVPGVGPAIRRRLLRRFGSVENVRTASRTDLLDVPGVGDETVSKLQSRL